MRPPHWLPWLGPLLAAGAGALAGEYWLGGGFWVVTPLVDDRGFA